MSRSDGPSALARNASGAVLRVVGILSAMAICGSARLPAQAPPPGTRIITTAALTYATTGDSSVAKGSVTDTVIVGIAAGASLTGPVAATTDPRATVVFADTLRNTGNITDTFALSLQSRTGWPTQLFTDVNGNGVLDAGDVLITGPVVLDANGVVPLLVVVAIPATANTRGITDTLQLLAQSNHDPGVAATLSNLAQVRSAGIVVTLTQAVDKSTAVPGDVLTYTVSYAAAGPGGATNFRLVDLVPAGTAYLPGTLRLNGQAQTDAAGDDAGSFDAAGNRIVILFASISGGDSGAVIFQVRVAP